MKAIPARGLSLRKAIILIGIIACFLALALLSEETWASPGRNPLCQTVPTPPKPSPPGPSKRESPPAPPPPSPTISPTPRQATPTQTTPPTHTATPTSYLSPRDFRLTLPAASPSPTLSFTPSPTSLAPAPKGKCAPKESELSLSKFTRFDLLEPCRILIEVPAGAVSERFLARLSPSRVIEAPLSQPSLEMRSLAFKFEVFLPGSLPLRDFTFAKPYTVTVRYLTSDSGRLVIAHFNEEAGRWQALESVVDVEHRLVSAKWDRVGWLALMAQIASPTSTPQIQPETKITPPSEQLPASSQRRGNSIPLAPGLLAFFALLFILAFLKLRWKKIR